MKTGKESDFKLLLEAYKSVLEMAEEIRDKEIENIEDELQKKGQEAVIAGKMILAAHLRRYHKEHYSMLTPTDQHSLIEIDAGNQLKEYIFGIEFDIENYLGLIPCPDSNHPASQALFNIYHFHKTILSANLEVTQKVVKRDKDVFKVREYAVELKPPQGKSIILCKDDLMAMLSIVTNNIPD